MPRKIPAKPTDGMESARLRMRHLAPWHIEPVPMVALGAQPAAAEGLSDEARQRLARLSLKVMAVQMCNADSYGSPKTSLLPIAD